MYKKKALQPKHGYRIYRLHRECVRRNEEFGKDYGEWAATTEKPMKSMLSGNIIAKWMLRSIEPLPVPHERPPLGAILKTIPLGVVRLPHEERIDPRTWKALNILQPDYRKPNPPHPGLSGLLVMNYYPEEGFPGNHYRSVLNMRWPEKVLRESVTRFIRERLQERKQAGLKQQTPNYKIRLGQCVEFLKVYDLKKEGKSYRDISLTIESSNRLVREQKAKEYYRRGRQLVMNPPLLGAPYSQ